MVGRRSRVRRSKPRWPTWRQGHDPRVRCDPQLIYAASLPLTIVGNWLNYLPTIRLTRLPNDVEFAELPAAASGLCNRQAAYSQHQKLVMDESADSQAGP